MCIRDRLQPSLEPDGFNTERGVVLEEIAQYADQPNEQVLQLLLSKGCDQHPYGRPILGTPRSLEAMTPGPCGRFISGSTAVPTAAWRWPGLRQRSCAVPWGPRL